VNILAKKRDKLLSIEELYKVFSELKNFTVANEPVHEESEISIFPTMLEKKEMTVDNVSNIEDIQLYDLQEKSDINIKYFMDGIQRTIFLGYIFNEDLKIILPIDYMIAGAVILVLDNKNLKVYDYNITANLIIPPKDKLPQSFMDLLGENYIELSISDYDFYRDNLRSAMNHYATRERMKLERNIVYEFNKKYPDEWIVIDGALTEKDMFTNEKFLDSKKKIGVIKRHVKHYFEEEFEYSMFKLFQKIKADDIAKRSWIFALNRKINGEVVNILSCYTKLFFNNLDPYFSLIRIEVLDDYKSIFNDIITAVRQFRFPLSYPSDVWDKKLYPIKVCEEFLKTQIPSVHIIKDFISQYKYWSSVL
jgi:hypothetical protein